ncbi:unnamed protein product, partial [Pylaiella littoralis]
MASKRPFDDGVGGGGIGGGESLKRPRRTAAADPEERVRARAEAKMAEVMSSLTKHKHAGLFLAPVDPRTAPGYEKCVKTPMDLGTIDRKLRTGGFAGDILAFAAQVRLVFANCLAYNPPGDWARAWGESCGGAFEAMYDAKLAPLLAAQAEEILPEDGGDAGEEQPSSEARGSRGKLKRLKVRLMKSNAGGSSAGGGSAGMTSSGLPPAAAKAAAGAVAPSKKRKPQQPLGPGPGMGATGGGGIGGDGGKKVLPKIRITFNAKGAPKISPRPGREASTSPAGAAATPKSNFTPLRITPPSASVQQQQQEE